MGVKHGRAVAAAVAVGRTPTLKEPLWEGGRMFWLEQRPQEKGRTTLWMRAGDGSVSELTPAPRDVRSRVHEYGGSSYWVLDDALVFVNFQDQRLYLQRGEAALLDQGVVG